MDLLPDPPALVHGDVRAAVNTLIGALSGAVGGWTAGTGAPHDLSDLSPVVGGWGWSPVIVGWVSPAYVVSWNVGDTLALLPATDDGAIVELHPTTITSGTPSGAEGAFDPGLPFANARTGEAPATIPASLAGTGLLYVIEYEPGFAGPTAPPRPAISPLDYLGDITLADGATAVPWLTDPGSGADGQFYLDTLTRQVYGPRTRGVWGTPIATLSPAGVQYPADQSGIAEIVADWQFDVGPILVASDNSLHRLVVAADGTLSTVPA